MMLHHIYGFMQLSTPSPLASYSKHDTPAPAPLMLPPHCTRTHKQHNTANVQAMAQCLLLAQGASNNAPQLAPTTPQRSRQPVSTHVKTTVMDTFKHKTAQVLTSKLAYANSTVFVVELDSWLTPSEI